MCVTNCINKNINIILKSINFENYIWKYIFFLGWLEKKF